LRQRGLLYFFAKHRTMFETAIVWILLVVGTIARCAGAAVGIILDRIHLRGAEAGRRRLMIYSRVLLRLFVPSRDQGAS
jgi:hypothetical protein